jgi:hypothetical protein
LSYSLNNTTWEKDRVSTKKSQEIEDFMEWPRGRKEPQKPDKPGKLKPKIRLVCLGCNQMLTIDGPS